MADIDIGIVTGTEIGPNKDSDEDVLLLQVTMLDENDVQTVELMTQSGEDSRPVIGSVVSIVQTGDADKIAIAVDDGIVPSVDEGEKELYSLAQLIPGTGNFIKKARIKWKTNGELEINGNQDFAVRFDELETAFNELKTDFNNLITLFDAHLHSGVTTGPGNSGPPTAPGTGSTADISDAKVETVLMPSVIEEAPP